MKWEEETGGVLATTSFSPGYRRKRRSSSLFFTRSWKDANTVNLVFNVYVFIFLHEVAMCHIVSVLIKKQTANTDKTSVRV